MGRNGLKQFKKLITTGIYSALTKEQRDKVHSLKRFSFFHKPASAKNYFIFCVDGTLWSGGLTDRFKGIISTFAFCLIKNMDYRIHYVYPFDLYDYLRPNDYDWRLKKGEISFNIFTSSFVYFIGNAPADRLRKINPAKQIHCFANKDILADLNQEYGTAFEWGDLFKKLFKPAQQLQLEIDRLKSFIGGRYTGINFRFQNLLGDFPEYNYQPLKDTAKKLLIHQCREGLLSVMLHLPREKFLVTSDSAAFLNSLSDIEEVYVIDGCRTHADSVPKDQSHTIDFSRSFLDFYLLADAKSVYSIGTAAMYPSAFPMYAAKLNNIPFHRIEI
ncbi:MAG: hypothetical protein QM640_03130 [Niabella sp.]